MVPWGFEGGGGSFPRSPYIYLDIDLEYPHPPPLEGVDLIFLVIGIIIYLYKIAILHHGMQSFHNNRLLHACLLHARLLHGCDVTHISSIGRFSTSISLREHANERYAECLGMNWCSKHLIIINNPTQNDLFTEIDNFIEVYNNSVIELIQCFGTSFFGRIDHLASSVIKFRPKNSVPKHCIRSITYNY